VPATTVKYVETHPNHANEAYQISKPVIDQILTQNMFCADKQSILEKIKELCSSPVTIQ
jgi:hypothetical protein